MTAQPVKAGHQLDAYCATVAISTLPEPLASIPGNEGEYIFACRWSRPQMIDQLGAKIVLPVMNLTHPVPIETGEQFEMVDHTPAALKRPTR